MDQSTEQLIEKLKAQQAHEAKIRRRVIFAVLLVVIFGGIIIAALSHADTKPHPALSAEQTFKNNCIVAGKCTCIEWYIKNYMDIRDPDSYQEINSYYVMKGDTALVYVKFRAKNGFGGYVITNALGLVKNDSVLNVKLFE